MSEAMQKYAVRKAWSCTRDLSETAFDTNVEIEENGVRYMVDVKDGQKTGFFLDQKYNRKAIQHLCKDAKVLDCFTHTGSFALNAGYGGAKEVTGVDASELAVEQATLNSKLNGMEDRVKFICRDVFELLPELEEKWGEIRCGHPRSAGFHQVQKFRKKVP